MTIILPDRPLPEGWLWARLGEVCAFSREAIAPDDLLVNELPCVGLENIASNTGQITLTGSTVKGISFRFDERHVLYGKLRPYLNKVACPTFTGRCSTEIIPLLPKESVDRKYLGWYLRLPSTVDFAMKTKTGSRMPRADMKEFSRLPIPLPPLDEQRRIVARLEERLAAAERTRRAAEDILAAMVAMPKSLLREILPLGQNLPQRWRWARLGKVCKVFAGGPAPQGQYYFGPEGPFFFRVSDLGVYGRTKNLARARDRLSLKSLSGCHLVPVRERAVLFPKSGAAIATNNRALLGVDGYLVSHLMALEAKDAVLPEWLYYTVCQIDMMDYADNPGYPSLKKSVVERIPIPLPPLDEQRRIVARLEEQLASVEAARRQAEEMAEAAKAIPAALLRDAFAGAL